MNTHTFCVYVFEGVAIFVNVRHLIYSHLLY